MGRLLITSDWHGMLDEAKKLLEVAHYIPGVDELIVLGDWVDRGPSPIATVQFMMQLKKEGGHMVHPVMGNHESMFLELLDEIEKGEFDPTYFGQDRNGTEITYRQFNKLGRKELMELTEFMEFITKLPHIVYKEGLMFVHAGVNINKPLNKQSEYDVLHIYGIERRRFILSPVSKNTTIVFGHTPTDWNSYKIWYDPINKDKIGIDCGGVFGGNLALLSFVWKDGRFVPDEEFYVSCERKWGR